MSETPRPENAEPSPPGRRLAAARAARGLTITEIALRLKFAPKQIEALEADRYEALAGPAFVRGMVRAYAKLVGEDADALIAALRTSPLTAAGPTVTGPRAIGVAIPRQPRRGSMVYVVLSVFVVIAVTGVIGEWLLRPVAPPKSAATRLVVPAPAVRESVAPPPAAAGQIPTQLPTQASVIAVPGPVETVVTAQRIELDFNRESWVEIRDAEGRVVFSQLNRPGTRREVEGVAPFSIVIGNAHGVKLRYNDSDVDLMPYTRTDVARLTLK
jgi:cytoskeleton protein RodZ